MDRRLLGTLLKAGRVLDLFTNEHPEWGVTDVAQALALPKSSAHALLASLEEIRLLQRTTDGRFKLGWRMLEFGNTALVSSDVFARTRQVMLDLGDQYKKSVYLAVLDGKHVLFVSRLQGADALPAAMAEFNETLPPHASAAGKLLLAHERDERLIDRALDGGAMRRFTSRTITSRAELKEELARSRELGYATSLEEGLRGLCCIAAPVRDENGKVIASIGVSTNSIQFQANKAQLIGAVTAAANRASRIHGWRAPGAR